MFRKTWVQQALRAFYGPGMWHSVQTHPGALPRIAIFIIKERVMNKLLSTLAVSLFALGMHAPSFAADEMKADANAKKEMAKGDYKATKDKADAREKAAKEECSKMSGADESACKDRAKAHAKHTKANAKANYDQAKEKSKEMK
jgi:hypothetical protein